VGVDPWGLRVKQSGSRGGTTSDHVWVRGEWLYGRLSTWDEPAEILVGKVVKRIERVFEKDQRKRVPGEAVLYLYGASVNDVPAGAVIRGPVS
jgi:hypothetical protein